MKNNEVLVIGNSLPEGHEFAQQIPRSTTVRFATPDNIHLMDGVRVSQIYILDSVHLDSVARNRLAYIYRLGQPQGGNTIMDEILSCAKAEHARVANNLYGSIERANEDLDNLVELNEALEQLLKVYLTRGRHGEREG